MTKDVLRRPNLDLLPDYQAALKRGWSPDNTRPEAATEQLAESLRDPDAFVDRLEDPEGNGPPITLPNGTKVPRLPSLRRWIWRDGFAGSIGLRWQKGTEELPPTCLGHIGYAVVPWRRREGLATAALIGILPLAKHKGLRHVDLTADPANTASIRVIENAGGELVKTFEMPAVYGGRIDALFRIIL